MNEEVRSVIVKAGLNPDEFAVEMVYRDKKGKRTRRTISPTKVEDGQDKFGAMCLCREELRTFCFENVEEAKLVRSHEVLAPVAIIEL